MEELRMLFEKLNDFLIFPKKALLLEIEKF